MLIRFPLELEPVRKPRESWLRVVLSGLVLIIILAAWALAAFTADCDCDTDVNCEQQCGGSVSGR
jgi:hypothetical protein